MAGALSPGAAARARAGTGTGATAQAQGPSGSSLSQEEEERVENVSGRSSLWQGEHWVDPDRLVGFAVIDERPHLPVAMQRALLLGPTVGRLQQAVDRLRGNARPVASMIGGHNSGSGPSAA